MRRNEKVKHIHYSLIYLLNFTLSFPITSIVRQGQLAKRIRM